ncbi:B-cell receptor CD22-like isoform X2 [Siniperca chuatsi]|uniref:B-cell receptor CD22-like isoform X2 n=1 Tax=Siniperca chuatsi TaxID=119488 RepID=UPI001CE1FE9C|nr:B-cell receptor CD22-like isoform X2 [Siniperca chuatsi]XP_044062756.1 B-cell receptor CD22-like isoform X2 [Siniperca chuatsi]
MAFWDKKIPWGFLLMLTGAVGQSVNYPDPVCAVKGSTVTLPCTFTPLKSVIQNGREVSIEIIRVVWCQNYAICQGPAPSVYDSESNNNSPRYKYLGDKKGNCTLQISDLQEDDDATLRFRMEADKNRGHHTGQSGVKLTVTDWTRMEINSCSGDRQVRRGETVTLCCTADCTVHPLEITWFRDGHALSESGPAFHLSSLTPEDSGNYTCRLEDVRTLSPPYSLHVEAEEEGTNGGTADVLLAVRLLLFTLHTVLIVIVAAIVIKRTRLRDSSCSSKELKDVAVQVDH